MWVTDVPVVRAPPILGNPYTANTHTKANSLSHVCRPCCGSLPDVLESEGPKLSTEAFYCIPQLSDWPVYDEVNDVFKPTRDASMVSLLDSTHDEAYALAIVSLYCDSKEISSKDGKNVGNAIPNKKKLSLCRAEWKKQAIACLLYTSPSPRDS